MKIYKVLRNNNGTTRQYYISSDIQTFANSLTQLWLRKDLDYEFASSSCTILPQTEPKQITFEYTRIWIESWNTEPYIARYTIIELDESLEHYAIAKGYIEKMLKEQREAENKPEPTPKRTQVIR